MLAMQHKSNIYMCSILEIWMIGKVFSSIFTYFVLVLISHLWWSPNRKLLATYLWCIGIKFWRQHNYVARFHHHVIECIAFQLKQCEQSTWHEPHFVKGLSTWDTFFSYAAKKAMSIQLFELRFIQFVSLVIWLGMAWKGDLSPV